jgi:hypothetical protein
MIAVSFFATHTHTHTYSYHGTNGSLFCSPDHSSTAYASTIVYGTLLSPEVVGLILAPPAVERPTAEVARIT